MTSRARRFMSEAAVVAALMALAYWSGAGYVAQWRADGRPQSFYQNYFEPAAMIACGYGYSAALPYYGAAMNEFLQQRVDRFDCSLLPADQEVSREPMAQSAWFYLMWMVGLYWWVAGISWSGLVPLFGALFALVIALAYAIFRMTVPVVVAAPATAILAFSELHLQNLPHLRDYAKAPLVLGLLLILFHMIRRPTPRRLLALSVAYGLLLGVGYGFRTDLLANIPPFLVSVAVFVPGWSLRAIGRKAAAIALAAATFVGASWPALSYVSQHGGCQWHVVLLGLDQSFSHDMGLEPSYYQWISHLSDEYIHSSVNSFTYRVDDEGPVGYCTTAYDAASGAELVTMATSFPGDFVTRTYASTLRVMDLPFYLWTANDPRVVRSEIGQFLTHFAGAARLAVVVGIVLIGATSWRLGAFALIAMVYFGGYPSLQFGQRHFFHFEFIGWWALASLAWQSVRLVHRAFGGPPLLEVPTRQFVRQAAAFAAVAAVAVLSPLYVARAYQDRAVADLTRTLLDAPRIPVPMTPDDTGHGLRRLDRAPMAPAQDVEQTVYLDVQLDLDRCPSGAPLRIVYDHGDAFHDYSDVVVPQPPDTVPERVLLPVFRGFAGLDTGTADAACVSSVERLRSVSGAPLLPVLTLPREWTSLPRHQRIGPTAWRLLGRGE